MFHSPKLCLALVLLFASALVSAQKLSDQEIEQRVNSLLQQMTLEEKAGQLTQFAGNNPQNIKMIKQGKVGSLLGVLGAEQANAAQRAAVEGSRLKIPLILGYDVIHGYRTIFPVPLASAGSFDPQLIEQAERVAAKESTASGVKWVFAPMVDIARDPRWGRIAEGAGEDPYLGSALAAARVRGFQGKDLRAPDAVMATVKHFAAYGGAEGGRDYNTVDVSERTLREIYLPPYHAAVEAGAGSIMTSFNEIGGVPSHANRWLVTTLLRDEWKFPGFVVSDWTGVEELRNHGVAGSRADAG